MNFNKHSDLEGKHAFLGASTYHWLNYTDEKVVDSYMRFMAKEKGTRLHAFAAECIELGQKLPRSKQTLNAYVNDAIGFKMKPEVMLYYSQYAFGTADAISFARNFLRIHDLKTGTTPASIKQLYIYVAFFCLEYKVKPAELAGIECRLYQNDDIIIENPGTEEIVPIMDKIVTFDRLLRKAKNEED